MMHDKHLDEMKRSGLPPAERRRSAARRRAGGRGGRQPISIPGLQVLPIVKLDERRAASAPVRAQSSRTI
jgi:hypothetical protein